MGDSSFGLHPVSRLIRRGSVLADNIAGAVDIVDTGVDAEAVAALNAVSAGTAQGIAAAVDGLLPGFYRGIATAVIPLQRGFDHNFVGTGITVDKYATVCGGVIVARADTVRDRARSTARENAFTFFCIGIIPLFSIGKFRFCFLPSLI